MTSQTGHKYNGYLEPWHKQILGLHAEGYRPWFIAQLLFDAGARAHTSDLQRDALMTKEDHLYNLSQMVRYVLKKAGRKPPRKSGLWMYDEKTTA
jgi:hypothetical protein